MIEHLEIGRWYGGYDCGRHKRMQLYPDPLPSTEIKNGFILVKGILENGYPNYFVFKIGDNEWLRSDWFYENAKKYFDEISA